ncbi:MAG TPA: tetratricopeptide repeat protein [Acidocella sp.]|nr:tetratricopeptide repeat protein [Acidocella sp.]
MTALPRRRVVAPGLWPALAMLLASCHGTPSPYTQAVNPIGPKTLNVADAAIAGGDPNMALSVTQSILASAPDNVDALIHEGDAYYALQRCPAAEAAYQLALRYDPKATQAETGLGRCLLKTDPRAAELAFTRAIAEDPDNADALNDLGIARDLQGNFAGAVEPYSRALMSDPSMTAAEVNLGLSLALSGHGPEALQYLGPLATGPGATSKIRGDYAAALLASGRRAEAQQVLSIDLPPDQVRSAMRGFSELMEQPMAAPPPASLPAMTAAPVAPVAAAPSGDAAVQLGAFNSWRLAEHVWHHLDARDPALFAGRKPEITEVTVNRRIFYRLRVAGFENDAAASQFCGEAIAAGAACTLADF